MENKYYLLAVYGRQNIFNVGWFPTEDLRDRLARALHAQSGVSGVFFWLNLVKGDVSVGSYAAEFFMEAESHHN